MKKDAVIYISNRDIQLVCGTNDKNDMIKISKYHAYPLDEGCMINGVVTDEQPIRSILQTIRSEKIDTVRLVLDSGQIIIKNVTVPMLSRDELLKIVEDSLSSVDGTYEDLIYDYSILQSSLDDKEGGEILCCAVERKHLQSYIELFESENIKLKSIDVSTNALHKLTQEMPELTDHTYIVSVLDGNNVTSFLFENNHFTFSNRTRLFSQRGSDAFIAEMNSNVSQLIQFNKSKHSPFEIECVYFCGLDKEEEATTFSSIKTNAGIHADVFPNSKVIYADEKDKFLLYEYIFTIGCLIRK